MSGLMAMLIFLHMRVLFFFFSVDVWNSQASFGGDEENQPLSTSLRH